MELAEFHECDPLYGLILEISHSAAFRRLRRVSHGLEDAYNLLRVTVSIRHFKVKVRTEASSQVI